jgi:hypothetical protein
MQALSKEKLKFKIKKGHRWKVQHLKVNQTEKSDLAPYQNGLMQKQRYKEILPSQIPRYKTTHMAFLTNLVHNVFFSASFPLVLSSLF